MRKHLVAFMLALFATLFSVPAMAREISGTKTNVNTYFISVAFFFLLIALRRLILADHNKIALYVIGVLNVVTCVISVVVASAFAPTAAMTAGFVTSFVGLAGYYDYLEERHHYHIWASMCAFISLVFAAGYSY